MLGPAVREVGKARDLEAGLEGIRARGTGMSSRWVEAAVVGVAGEDAVGDGRLVSGTTLGRRLAVGMGRKTAGG